MSFARSWKRNLAYLRLGVAVKLQHRTSFFAAVLVGPSLNFLVEAAFWSGCFDISGMSQIGGFALSQYLTYLLWLILQLGGANWRFERAMISQINTGAVNAMLVRPGSFYGLHFGDLLGFKLMTLAISLPLMFAVAYGGHLPLMAERVLPALLMGIGYLVLIHTVNFALACMAFRFDHVYSLNTTKNMILWFLTGELFPLDLLPSSLSEWVIRLPFSCGVYIPASYISGRIGTEAFLQGFVSLAIGIGLIALFARFLWGRGLRHYTGTGA